MFSSSAPFISTMRFPQSFLQPCVSAGHFSAVHSRRLFFSRAFPPVIFTAVRFRRSFLQPCVSAGHFSAVRSRRLFLQPYVSAGHFYSRAFPPAIFQPYIPAIIFTAVHSRGHFSAVRFRGHSYCLTLKCTPSCSAIFLQFSIFSSPITSTTLRMVYIPSAAAERAKSSIML